MSGSKNRPLWCQLRASTRAAVEQLIGGSVVHARNCSGGYSPGFASLLTLMDGRQVFVKAMDAERWPVDAAYHRVEAKVSAALPATVPAPRLLGTLDDDDWVVLAFEAIDGVEPCQPWNDTDLHRVVTAIVRLGQVATPSPIALPRDHPRLGGWTEVARDDAQLAELARHSTWAMDHIAQLIRLESDGVAAARGDSLVHFDLSPHNILLTPNRVMFIDWPHARLGASAVDLIMILSSADDRIDRDSILNTNADLEPQAVDAILAAHAGFQLRGGVSPKPLGLEAIAAIDLRLGLAALSWLHRRLSTR
ncbi:MAG TPA: aminoglycoside phosphotransferase family protein [Mycobacteriales bacterium]